MKVIDIAVKKVYRFNCPNCQSRLEADSNELTDIGGEGFSALYASLSDTSHGQSFARKSSMMTMRVKCISLYEGS